MFWQWRPDDPAYANYGNANQWTVNAGLPSLARESMQNSNDARLQSSEPAEVVFTFIRLTDEHRRQFEAALDWAELQRHIDAMAGAARGSATAGQITTGIQAVRKSAGLHLLRIADFGCFGLTGPELQGVTDEDDYGNFIKLCRLDLFSGKEEAAGESFGLGKAVYWRFSRLQTVLFNSTVQPGNGIDDKYSNRLFGVQQGVVHRLPEGKFNGRGFFGDQPGGPGSNPNDPVVSSWEDADLAGKLQVARIDDRTGTSALIVGFYDPDDDQAESLGLDELRLYANKLRQGVEESFWPLIARDRVRVRIEIVDNDELVESITVDPAETYPELVQALRRYDDGDIDEALSDDGSVVVRDIPIKISRRKAGSQHKAFEHRAKLVVTKSDSIVDSLENQVCLLRRSEMVVERIKNSFDGHKYHSFLLAGGAVSKDSPTAEDLLADDFLRYAEPPAHDQWIPRTGPRQVSQVNLGAHYVKPYRQNLEAIRTTIDAELKELFGPPKVAADKPPASILKNLKFLRSGTTGSDGEGGGPERKPRVSIDKADTVKGAWQIDFTISAPNRTQGWSVVPVLEIAGQERNFEVDWATPLEPVGETRISDNRVQLLTEERRRVLKARVRAQSDLLPLPASEAVVELVLREVAAADEAK